MSSLIGFECLACLLIWWAGVITAVRRQPEHHDLDMRQRQRRADFVRNELDQRPLWWLMLSGLAMVTFVHWFMDRWDQRPWRAAMLWTITMIFVLVVVLTLTQHYGWAMRSSVG